jgi:uncharacterized membrane protein
MIMKSVAFIALLWALSTPAIAQMHGPALYNVVGVEANDQLHIRAEPDAEAELLGSLPPNAQHVEVTGQSADGKWARINHNESSGWVALRYLSQRATWADGTPFGLACSGTEPFWSARLVGGVIEYSEMSGQSTQFREVDRLRGAGVGFADLAILGEAEGQPVTMIIAPEACNDGMSGRDYALRVHFLRPGTSMPLLSGCCSMTAEQ